MPENFIHQIQESKEKHDSSTVLSQYETPLVTVDIVLLTVAENSLKVLLIQRKGAPFEHMWALPGGFIRVGETLEESAARRLLEETNVDNIYLEQLRAFGKPGRDPRAGRPPGVEGDVRRKAVHQDNRRSLTFVQVGKPDAV